MLTGGEREGGRGEGGREGRDTVVVSGGELAEEGLGMVSALPLTSSASVESCSLE